MTDQLARREAALYAALDALGVAHRTVRHEATATVAQGAAVKAHLAGGHSKSLLVTDRRASFLLVALGSVRVDLKGVARALGAGRLSFASPQALAETLGLTPGNVTPFGLVGAPAPERIARVVLDEALLAHDPVWCHPLRNTASTAVSPQGLQAFLAACGRPASRMDLARPA